jgi:plastocyanin
MKVSFSSKIISANAVTIKPTTIPTTQTTPGQQPSSNKVSIGIVYGASDINNQVHYTPSNIQISPGTTIVWTNNDSVPHRIVSGIAKAVTAGQSIPVFTTDGKIDSGILSPGQSFQFTITNFDTTKMLDQKVAQLYNIPQNQTVGDITFFDPTYPFMVGIIAPLIPPSPAQGNIVQMNIVSGASNPNNGQFLSPSSIRITAGSTLELVNNDSVPHQIQSGNLITTTSGNRGTSYTKQPQFTPDDILSTGVIAPGQHYRVTVTTTGTIQIFDPSFTWINGVVVSSSTISTTQITPVQISIALGSSLQKGTATQQQFNQYNSYYYPDTIQIVPGTQIIWVNNDSIEHTILSGVSTQKYATNPFTPDGKIASGKIAPGQTFTAVINDTGIIRFYDPQYTWMNGVIISMPPTQSYTIGAPSHNPNLH